MVRARFDVLIGTHVGLVCDRCALFIIFRLFLTVLNELSLREETVLPFGTLGHIFTFLTLSRTILKAVLLPSVS